MGDLNDATDRKAELEALLQEGRKNAGIHPTLLNVLARFGDVEVIKSLLEAGAKERPSEPEKPVDAINTMFGEIVDRVITKRKNSLKP